MRGVEEGGREGREEKESKEILVVLRKKKVSFMHKLFMLTDLGIRRYSFLSFHYFQLLL